MLTGYSEQAGSSGWTSVSVAVGTGEGMRTPHPPTSATTDTQATQDYHRTRTTTLLTGVAGAQRTWHEQRTASTSDERTVRATSGLYEQSYMRLKR